MARLEKEPRRFLRAADMRLHEARFLLEHDYTTAAVYLAGYAVECMLKTLILANEPAARHTQTMKSFRGVHGHTFRWLREELGRRRVNLPATIIKVLTRVNVWSTNLRYDPSVIERADAEEFVAAVDEIVVWMRERL